MKRRILSFLLALMLLLTPLTAIEAATTISIVYGPAVFIVGDNYNIMWSTTTSTPALGYVEYTYNGTSYRVYDEDNGIVRTDDYIHVVTVPKEHLDGAGSYKVTAVPVNNRTAYGATYGTAVSSSSISFRGYSESDTEINVYTVSDTHLKYQEVLDSVAQLKGEVDLLAMNGDITNTMNYINDLSVHIIRLSNAITGGSVPTVYVRGNHESHGKWSGYLEKYFSDDSGNVYHTFTYGPLACLALDYGEDKPDTYPTFKGVVDFKNQYANQFDWVNSLGGYGDENTQYRISFIHGADLRNHYSTDLLKPLDAYGTDLLVCGHHHQLKLEYPANFSDNTTDLVNGETGWKSTGVSANWCYDFPIFIDGSEAADADGNTVLYNTSQLILKDGTISIYGVKETEEGVYETYMDCSFDAGKNTIDTSYVPSVFDLRVDRAENTTADSFISGWNSGSELYLDQSDGFKIITKPTVFDTGDTYTVTWATTEGMSATGEVYVEYDGKLLRFADGEGPLRTVSNGYSTLTATVSGGTHNVNYDYKNLHSVEIPKKYLENNRYKLINRHVIDAYYLSFDKGITVESGFIQFNGYTGQDEINMLFTSDLSSDSSLVSDIKSLNTDFDMLVLGGNTVRTLEGSSNVTNELLLKTGELTGGTKPVAFVRGENETVGEFAPYLIEYVSNSTNEFYSKISYGPVTAIILDTAGTQADSAYKSGSYALASFSMLRQKQKTWLSEQSYGDAEYKIAFSNADGLYNFLDTNYSRELNSLGTDLLVTGNTESSSFTALGFASQNYAVANSGQSDGTVATLLTFKNGSIMVKPVNADGSMILSNTVNASDNDVSAFADVAATAWYAEAVNYTATQRIMLGTSADTFAPENNLTRGMAVVALARLSGAELENCTDTVFTDVDCDDYYASAVVWAYKNGITNGTSTTTFSPDSAITREQFATMFYRLYKDKLTIGKAPGFADTDTVSDYAKDAVNALWNAGIINGVGDDLFAPHSNITRAQLAQIIFNSGF